MNGTDERNETGSGSGVEGDHAIPSKGDNIDVVFPVQPEGADSEISRLKSELEETKNRLLRIAADFDNYKKRAEKERIEFQQFAGEKILKDVLSVLDNLERAVSALETKNDLAGLKEGLRMIISQFSQVLIKHGVEPVSSFGSQFDPSCHEALHQVESDEHPSGQIIEEYQKGYLYNKRLLRPALVVVARQPENTSPEIEIVDE
ncbi:MAG: nucleotide exchange factor GrpE [Deltaproteobacteria bacterium]|nr:nucleotide exchange factor GrpE [Deltaproteobacteria bacterium]